MKTYEAPRKMLLHFMDLDAPPTEVFPLLCPIREYEWVDGWACEPVHLSSGFAEEDGIFMTGGGDEPLETWVITRYLPPQEIEFVRVTDGRVIRLNVRLKSETEGRTRAFWRTLITATSAEGAAAVEGLSEDVYKRMIGGFGKMLGRYLATGQRLATAPGTADSAS